MVSITAKREYTLTVEWVKGGEQMVSLLERIVGRKSDGYGCCLVGVPTWDASWTFASRTAADSAKTRLISRGYRRAIVAQF